MKRFNLPTFVGLFFLISNLIFVPFSSASDTNFINIASGSDEVTVTQSTRRSLRGGRHTTRVVVPEPTVNVTAVPIPASALLFGSGLLGFSLVSRRK
tara:strand:- start:204 stop:494 length:291 start_codon:yes stop_codon:yes gene_type:complete